MLSIQIFVAVCFGMPGLFFFVAGCFGLTEVLKDWHKSEGEVVIAAVLLSVICFGCSAGLAVWGASVVRAL